MLKHHADAGTIEVDARQPSTLRTARASATATVTSSGHPPHGVIADLRMSQASCSVASFSLWAGDHSAFNRHKEGTRNTNS
jgi:hypothetical protein